MMVVASNTRIVENFYNQTDEERQAKHLKAQRRRVGTWSEAMHDTTYWNELAKDLLTDDEDDPGDPPE